MFTSRKRGCSVGCNEETAFILVVWIGTNSWFLQKGLTSPLSTVKFLLSKPHDKTCEDHLCKKLPPLSCLPKLIHQKHSDSYKSLHTQINISLANGDEKAAQKVIQGKIWSILSNMKHLKQHSLLSLVSKFWMKCGKKKSKKYQQN